MAKRAYALGDSSADRGASAVEFTLVMIPLLLLVMGLINFGIMFGQQLALNNGVRQGARAAVVSGTEATCAQVVSAVRDATTAIAITPSQINVVVQTDPAGGDATTTLKSTRCGSAANPTSANVVCVNSLQSNGTLDSVVVTAQYPAKFIVPWPVPGLPTTRTLTSKAVYRCEFTSS